MGGAGTGAKHLGLCDQLFSHPKRVDAADYDQYEFDRRLVRYREGPARRAGQATWIASRSVKAAPPVVETDRVATLPKSRRRAAIVALFAGAIGIGFAPILVRLSQVGPSATAAFRILMALPILWLLV